MRFKECRLISNMSIKEVCKCLDIKEENYLLIESEVLDVSLDFIKAFCEVTSISANYLLEIIDEPLKISLGRELLRKKIVN